MGKLKKSLIIVNTYFQPGAAQANQLQDLIKLVESFKQAYAPTPIIIMGDFNAGIDSDDQLKLWDKQMLEAHGILDQELHNSVGNVRGRKLAEALASINQLIVNGRLKDDQPAASTFVGSRGVSLFQLRISV